MGTFKDTAGREWRLRLTAGLATRIREATGRSILLSCTVEGIKQWEGYSLPDQPEKFVQALWLMIERQATAATITRDQFEDAFDPDTYRAAAAAYYDSILSFSQTPGLLKSIFGSGKEMVSRLQGTTANASATNSEASAESTPGNSLSAN